MIKTQLAIVILMIIFVLSGCATLDSISTKTKRIKQPSNISERETKKIIKKNYNVEQKTEAKKSPLHSEKKTNMLLEFILGFIVAILAQRYYEESTQPKLKIESDFNDPLCHVNSNWGGYHLLVSNVRGLLFFRTRRPAWNVRVTIDILNNNGTHRIIHETIQGRWARSPEPLTTAGTHLIVDISRVILGRQTNIFANDPQQLDIAIKYDNDPYCYIWSNESYIDGGIGGRRRQWELDQGTYQIIVKIFYEVETIKKTFLLENHGTTRNSLRLIKVG